MQTKQRVKLQRERERQNLSQEEVAAAIGATVRSISRWEQGESTPKPYYRMRLCELFHKKADELDLEPLEADLEFVEPENAFYDPMIPPRPSLQLIGREYILQQIKFALLQNRDVAIFGMAGIGKSALAVALAYDQDVRLHFSGGILWEALGPAPDVAHTLARWKTQLSPTSPPFTKKMTLRDMARDVRMSITQSRLLVVIDDAWDLKNALTLHALGANCTHLTTTRLSDVAFYLARHPYVVELEELSEVESMSLLQSLAPAVIQEQQRTQQLVRIVGGHPLALTVLGKYLQVQSHGGQSRRIHTALERLSQHVEQRLHIEEERGPNEQHTSLSSDRNSTCCPFCTLGFSSKTRPFLGRSCALCRKLYHG